MICKGISDALSGNALLSQCRIVSSIAWVTTQSGSCVRLEGEKMFGHVYWQGQLVPGSAGIAV